MRYVIFFAAIALFLIWDGLYNGGTYLNEVLGWVVQLMRAIGVN
jgi:hypothetical protein